MADSLKLKRVVYTSRYDRCKSQVLVCLYVYRYWRSLPGGLSIGELVGLAHVSGNYLKMRLPVFCGKAKYPLTGKLWNQDRLTVIRGTGERHGKPVFTYTLSVYGKHWVEDYLPRDRFYLIIEELGLKTSLNSTLVLSIKNKVAQRA